MELGFLQWINNNLHGSNFINYVFKFITYLGEVGWACILLGIVLLFFKKTRKSGVLVLISLAIGIIVTNLIVKPVVARPRPFAEDPSFVAFLQSINYKLPSEFSFPSGHAQVAFNSAMVMALLYKGKGCWAFLPAGLIAISRIFLCVHYPTDVLAGILIGVVSALITCLLISKLIDKIVEKYKLKHSKDKQKADNESI